MKHKEVVPPREIDVADANLKLHHCMNVELLNDELVTFIQPSGSAHDVIRKNWGYYASGSLNGRLPQHGLRPALMRNSAGRIYLVLVENDKEDPFEQYLKETGQAVLGWFDDNDFIGHILEHTDEGATNDS